MPLDPQESHGPEEKPLVRCPAREWVWNAQCHLAEGHIGMHRMPTGCGSFAWADKTLQQLRLVQQSDCAGKDGLFP